jgi:hypothetical protein
MEGSTEGELKRTYWRRVSELQPLLIRQLHSLILGTLHL